MERDGDGPPVSHDAVGPLARAGSAAAVVLAAAVVMLEASGRTQTLDLDLRLLSAAVWIGSGALLLVRGRASRMTVLVGSMLLFNGVAPSVPDAGSTTAADVFGRLVLSVALTLAVLTLAVFPDGRFVPTRLRWLVVAFAAWQLGTLAGTRGTVLEVVGGVVYFVIFGALVVAQVLRHRRETDPVRRTQTRWVVYGLSLFLVVELLVSLPYFAPGWFPDLVRPGSPYDSFQNVTVSVALLAVPVCITISMLVGNLFDVDVVISRTLVYGSLSLLVAGSYLGVVSGLGLFIGAHGDRYSPLAAAAVVTVLFGPLRAWLQQKVRRLVHGLRADPYAALSSLGRRLADSTPDDDVPSQLVSTVRQALRTPYVAVAVGDGSGFPIAAETGVRTSRVVTLPLTHAGEQVGLLLVGYDDRHRLSAAERALLDDLGRQAGSAVNGVRLNTSLRRGAAQLQAARERLVLTREEERRRLRRELHDGLAPTIAAAQLTAATAADMVGRDRGETEEALRQLQHTLQAAVGDIRSLVDELRPPALDERGLLHAVRDRLDELPGTLTAELDAVQQLPPLPAAVEVAAYRICQEALMNVVKHGEAHRVRVCLRIDDDLHLVVEDDGVGLPASRTAGVGLASMHERAIELGGSCTIENRTDRGVRLTVRLPVRAAREPSG